MAPRKSTIRKTRSEDYLVNSKHIGHEPTFKKEELDKNDCIGAFNWYNYMCTKDEAREYLEDYFLACDDQECYEKLKGVSDTWLPLTAAWIARLVYRGYSLPQYNYDYLSKALSETFSRAASNPVEPEIKLNAQDRIRERMHVIVGEIEGIIDDWLDAENMDEFSLYHWLRENNIPAVYTNGIIAKINPVLLEHIEAYEGKDEQLVEAYSYLTKKELKARIVFLNGLITDADLYSENAKQQRAPRKTKPVTVEKILKTFKWQKEDAEYKLTSVAPAKLLGSQEAWLFNTKYKILTVLRANDSSGLQVKGTTIVNHNEDNSMSRTTGRRTQEFLHKVMNSGKVALRKIMDELKTFAPLATRTNEHTIILRVLT